MVAGVCIHRSQFMHRIRKIVSESVGEIKNLFLLEFLSILDVMNSGEFKVSERTISDPLETSIVPKYAKWITVSPRAVVYDITEDRPRTHPPEVDIL